MSRPTTVGQLREAGYPDRTVKQELRANLLQRLGRGQELFESIVGYGTSVLPGLERGILAGHDIILLGERGQAKTRLIRHLVELLDDEIPVIEGCEVNDHPYHPICARCRALVAELGPETPVSWIGRDARYAEKLATPDTSVADLIGDVDPIRVAEGRYLADELTIHYGLIPRTNRGIFSVNELPDLPERIQVGLLNILEERDLQIRGYKVRLDLDIVLVASANPEDYTHRGRIITPLKDRFGTQVRTHYPVEIEAEIRIMDQEATIPPPDDGAPPVVVPVFLKEVLAELTRQLRKSSQVNQRSGVSVRYTIGNLETVAASALRRAVRAGEPMAVPRPVDLWAAVGASMGRIEFETLEEGREEWVLEQALKRALVDVYRRRLGAENLSALQQLFEEGLAAETSDVMGAETFLAQFRRVPGLGRIMQRLDLTEESRQSAASALEFALEGLHLSKRLTKHTAGPGAWKFGTT
ncbi:MAG TPA: sigma 54-interacting transcriptional regulator [Actinomycetota bacterium]|nr:sigma 54-interacting transcriptional regulator [Actinomycetota bacterium]